MANLATRADVQFVAYGRTSAIDISGSDIDTAIEDAQNDLFDDLGDSEHIQFQIFSTRRVYEFRKDRRETHEIKFVFVNSPNVNPNNAINRNQIPSASFTADLNANTLTFTAAQATSWNGSFVQVNFIPKTWHLLVKNKAALNLLDQDSAQINPGEGQVESPRVTRIAKRIRRLEKNIQPVEAQGSYENRCWDPRDKDVINQERFNRDP